MHVFRRRPRKRNPSKSICFHGAPAAVCGRVFAVPVDVSLSGDFVDWGSAYTAKVRLPVEPKPSRSLAAELCGALSDGAQ
jgi:hypothetical protein